ncbi:MAG: RNA polymerase subunit sigma-70 [Actinomycetes bacterium]
MSLNLDESRRLIDTATGRDPEMGLTAVVALRQLVEVLEELQVDNARGQGWSWRDIARRLGVTKQAVHYKHGLRLRGKETD